MVVHLVFALGLSPLDNMTDLFDVCVFKRWELHII